MFLIQNDKIFTAVIGDIKIQEIWKREMRFKYS